MVTSSTAAHERINGAGIDCTYRQFDYWCRTGLLGHDMYGDKPGWRREVTTADLEVIHALNEVRKVNQRVNLTGVSEIVRARPVHVDGEVLLVDADGVAYRFNHWCAVSGESVLPVIVAALRSFADVGLAVDVASAAGSPAGPVATISSS